MPEQTDEELLIRGPGRQERDQQGDPVDPPVRARMVHRSARREGHVGNIPASSGGVTVKQGGDLAIGPVGARDQPVAQALSKIAGDRQARPVQQAKERQATKAIRRVVPTPRRASPAGTRPIGHRDPRK